MKKIQRLVLLCTAATTLFFAVPAFAQKVFVFSPKQHAWFAYNDGQLVNSGRASGGSNWCKELGRPCHTPVGAFSVISKGSASCKSSKYPLATHGGAPMPYCMFFSKNYAIHGSNSVPNYNASHGCIRVVPSAAAWLSANFIDYGTRVIVKPY